LLLVAGAFGAHAAALTTRAAPGGADLVLSWPEPVRIVEGGTPGVLVLRADRPWPGPPPRPEGRLADLIDEVRQPEPRELVLVLADGVRATLSRPDGNTAAVALRRALAPEITTGTAADAALGRAASGTTTPSVAAGRRGPLGRLAFDLPGRPDYRVERTGDRLRLFVDGAGVPEVADVARQLSDHVAQAERRRVAGGTEVVLVLRPELEAMHTRLADGRILIDLVPRGRGVDRTTDTRAEVGALPPADPADVRDPVPLSRAETAARQGLVLAGRPAVAHDRTVVEVGSGEETADLARRVARAGPADPGPAGTAGNEAAAETPVALSAPLDRHPANVPDGLGPAATRRVALGQRPDPATTVPGIGAGEAQAAPAGTRRPSRRASATEPAAAVVVAQLPAAAVTPVPAARAQAETGPDGSTTLAYAWPVPAAAAVFMRAGALWVVFDRPNGPAVPTVPTDGPLAAGIALARADATVHRFPLRLPLAVRVDRVGTTWWITLDPRAPAPNPLTIVSDPDAGELRFEGAESAIALHDPAVGDRLLALTTANPGRGVASTRRLVDLELIASAQGAVLAWRSDRPTTLAANGEVRVSRRGGLDLGRPPAPRTAVPAIAPAAPRAG
jgi:hypothetical protein